MIKLSGIIFFTLAVFLPISVSAGGPPGGGARSQMIWLEPFSYMQMREMRERMKKMTAQRQSRSATPTGRPKSTSGKPASGRPAGGYSARIIHLRSGAYPPPGRTQMKGRMSPIRHARKATGAVKDFMWLEKPDHEILAIDPRQRRNKTTGNFNTAFGGDYRIVAYRDAGVRAGRHTHLYSFYEFMAHGDKPSLKKPAAEARAGYFEGSPEFQITRIYAQESERYRSRTGNKARLKVLYRGKPLSNKQVTMTTSLGWRQDLTTNDIGEAVFTLIKEDFPDGGVDKRKSSLYVARASHIVPVAGELGGTSYEASQYVATISIRVAPSALDWESQSTAYLVTFFTVGAAGTAIAIRRRRKKTKPARSNK